MNYSNVDQLIQIVDESITKAESLRSKIPAAVANLRGFSSPKIRHLINNICSHGPCRYLEIGTWAGSTLVPALYDNDTDAMAIDNFSQFGPEEDNGFNAKEQLDKNLETFEKHIWKVAVVNEDCFSKKALRVTDFAFNVFFYDGAHDSESTQKAIEIYGARCHQPFILLVDDWRLSETVMDGTNKGLFNFKVYKSWELEPKNDYHMGVAIFVLEKK